MDEDYYSVLVTVRPIRSDVYVNGLPVVEIVNGKSKIVTKRRDFDRVLEQLRDGLYDICTAKDVIDSKLMLDLPKE